MTSATTTIAIATATATGPAAIIVVTAAEPMASVIAATMTSPAVIAPIAPPVTTERVRVVVAATVEVPSVGVMHQVHEHLTSTPVWPIEEPDTTPTERLIAVD